MNGDLFSGIGVDKPDLVAVQLDKRPDLTTVAAVADNGHMPISELRADLVGSAGEQLDPDGGYRKIVYVLRRENLI